jgi:RNA polymerase sigma-70 factor (ECF subfamily)
MPQVAQQTSQLDVKEFERIFHRLQPRLYAYCRKYIDDGEQAKDIVQECFVHLWENRYDIIVSCESYLFRAVHNRCISYFRSLRVHTDYEISVKEKLKEIEIYPETPNQLTELYLKEINELLQQSVEKLPEKCRLVFMMSRYQGMKSQEIAAELGISVRTVDTQIYNALKIIKEELKDYLFLFLLFFPGIV